MSITELKRRRCSAVATGLIAMTLAVSAGAGHGQEGAKESPEMKALAASARAQEAAYEKRDAKAVAAFFAEDAELLTDDGLTIRGREAIEGAFRAAFLSRGKSTLNIETLSARSLAPGVVLEKGRTLITSEDGGTNGSLFTAVHTKSGDKWLISSLVETPLPQVEPSDRLSALNWLIGKWLEVDESSGLRIESEYSWARGGNYISCSVSVQKGEKVVMEGWQIIGWDPLEGKIRSWTFDSDGGMSEAFWTGDGNRWLIRDDGVAADGTRSAADNTVTKISDDQFTWESTNRVVSGEPQPGIGRITIDRVKGE